MRRTCASGRRSRSLKREAMWLKLLASASMPFIRMMRTRVNASSSSLLIGRPTMSFQVKRCRSSGVPFASNRLTCMGMSPWIGGLRPGRQAACRAMKAGSRRGCRRAARTACDRVDGGGQLALHAREGVHRCCVRFAYRRGAAVRHRLHACVAGRDRAESLSVSAGSSALGAAAGSAHVRRYAWTGRCMRRAGARAERAVVAEDRTRALVARVCRRKRVCEGEADFRAMKRER
jgi:hypothetical protein